MKIQKLYSNFMMLLIVFLFGSIQIVSSQGSNMLAHYQFDEKSDTIAYDATENQFDLGMVRISDANWVDDPDMGRCVQLDDTQKQYGILDSVSSIEFQASAFTIATYIKLPAAPANWMRIAGMADAYGFNVDAGGYLGLWCGYGADWHGSYSTTALPVDEWVHVALTHDDVAGNVFYMNGEVVHEQDWSDTDGNQIDYPGDSPFQIGSSGEYAYLNGFLDDLRVYDEALSAEQIRFIMNPVISSELIAHYPFKETSDTIAYDATENQFDLGMVRISDANWVDDEDMGRCVQLDDTQKQYGILDSLSSIEFQASAFTIATYIKLPAAPANWMRIAGMADAYGFNVDAGGYPGLWCGYGADWHGSYSTTALPVDEWVHVALTHDDVAGNVFYMNGAVVHEQDWSDTDGNQIDYPGDSPFQVGSSGEYAYLNGLLKDLRVYDGVLIAEEIDLIINPTVSQELFAHYPLDQTSDTVAIDKSGNGFDMPLLRMDDSNWESDFAIGNSLHFDDTQKQYGILDSVTSLEFHNSAFTIATYIKLPASPGNWMRVAGMADAYGFNVDAGGYPGLWCGYGADWHGSYSSTALPVGEWVHIALTHDDVSGNVFYMNGEVVHEQDWSDTDGNQIVFPGESPFQVGSSGEYAYLAANLNDLRYYKGALSQDEIKTLLKQLGSMSLLAHWNFDETTGTTAADATENAVDVPLRNTDDSNWGSGVEGGSLTLNGTDQDGLIAESDVFKLQEFTISAYIKHDTSMAKSGEWIFGHGDNYGLYLHGENGLTCYIYHTGGDWDGTDYNEIDLMDGYWHHVAGTWDSDTKAINLFIDGVFVKSDTMPGVIDWAQGSGAYIGNNAEDKPWEGSLDELRIHGVALTEPEIKEMILERKSFTSSVSGDGSGTVSPESGMYYPNEEITITAIPAEGSAFAGWDPFLGTIGGSDNPATVTISGDVIAAATFGLTIGVNELRSTQGMITYPNPFTDVLNIQYELREEASVQLAVFDMMGKEVAVLVNQTVQPGTYTLTWDGSNASSGVYFLRMKVGSDIQTQKIIVSK